jgi:hypothetical protein
LVIATHLVAPLVGQSDGGVPRQKLGAVPHQVGFVAPRLQPVEVGVANKRRK